MVGLFVFYVGYTFYAIPYWSLVDDYSEKDEARRRVYSNLLGGGIMIATAIVAVAVPMLLNDFDYSQKALILGSVCSVLMILPLFAAPKAQKRPVVRGGPKAQMSLFEGFGVAFKHRRFLALIALFSGSQMSFTVMTGAGLFITMDLLKGTESQMAFVLGPLILFAIPSFLFVPKISRKLGWEKGMLFASIGAAVVYGLSGFLGQSIVGSPIVTAGLLFAVGGPMVAILLGLEGEAVVDCATEHGGAELVGVYWGVFNFIVKVLNAIALNILFFWAGKMESMGDLAVRCMSFSAGGLLVIGVVAYFLIRRK
jgi:Na+/melibiose symporter-like transporter